MRSTHNPSSITHNLVSPYTFASKERDEESGLSYFGSRYYSSDLSIWLSVDPMSDKYPSLSPYVYCANNPVKLVDPNGEDYEVVVDHENLTITIKANYFSNKKNQQTLDAAIAAWNSQSGEYTYTSGEGENAKTYTINIELSAKYFNTDDEVQRAVPNNRNITNYFSKIDLSGTGKRGHTVEINVQSDNNAPLRTAIHEIGHSIGIYEGTTGVMISGGDSDVIYEEHIVSSLNRAGIHSREEYNCNVPEIRKDAVINKTYNMHGIFNHREQ